MDEEDDRLQCGCKWHATIEFYIRDLGVLEGGQLAVSKDLAPRNLNQACESSSALFLKSFTAAKPSKYPLFSISPKDIKY
ncbi:hypothetical protein VE00_08518 [Pseudogymnoascus sp. WSF 3629]|nr:hypothetical protein VE00_08518 [Pseudogymnoascus sp. WSF 3629]